jgi:hypothetical protein
MGCAVPPLPPPPARLYTREMSGDTIHNLLVTVEVDDKGEVTTLVQVFAAGENGLFELVELDEAVADKGDGDNPPAAGAAATAAVATGAAAEAGATPVAATGAVPERFAANAEVLVSREIDNNLWDSGTVKDVNAVGIYKIDFAGIAEPVNKDRVRAKFKDGDKVEAIPENETIGQNWRPGTVINTHSNFDGGYVIEFDDDENVTKHIISPYSVRARKPNNEVPPGKDNDSTKGSAAPIPEDKVLALYTAVEANVEGKWYLGIVISNDNVNNGGYIIKWAGSESVQHDVDPLNVRAAEIFKKGDQVMANFEEIGEWYPGKVDAVNENPKDNRTYTIKYDHNQIENDVNWYMVRARDLAAQAPENKVRGGTRRRASTSSRYTSRRLLQNMRAKRRANFMF